MPCDLSIAPSVPVYCLAASSDIPKDVAAFAAQAFILSASLPKVVSTTFCTSERFEASSMPCFAKSTNSSLSLRKPDITTSERIFALNISPKPTALLPALSTAFPSSVVSFVASSVLFPALSSCSFVFASSCSYCLKRLSVFVISC